MSKPGTSRLPWGRSWRWTSRAVSRSCCKALLAIAGLFEKAGIFERDGDIGAEDSEHAFVFGGEGVEVCAFQVENADETILK